MRNKFLFLPALALCLCLLSATVCAAESAEGQMFGTDNKVALHDTLNYADFVAAYNDICRYPLQDYGQKRPMGDDDAYNGIIDDNTVMVVRVGKDDKLRSVLLIHRGEVTETEREKLGEIFAAVNIALGHPTTNEGMLSIARVFNILKVADTEMTATRLTRRDIERDYVFLKAYTGNNSVLSILLEAFVTGNGSANERES